MKRSRLFPLYGALDVLQFSSVAQSCPTLCNPMDCSTPGFCVHHQFPGFAQTHFHWVGDAIQHLIFCHPLFLLPSIFPGIRVFSKESILHIRWPKYWSFRFSISLSNEYLGFQSIFRISTEYSGIFNHSFRISFRTDWFDLLEVQGTFKSVLQLHNSKASILPCSAYFMVQILHPYMTTGKTLALTIWTFVSKVMSLSLSFFFWYLGLDNSMFWWPSGT